MALADEAEKKPVAYYLIFRVQRSSGVSIRMNNAVELVYSLYEIATMTRAAPAKLFGLTARGHLGVNAVADVAVYDDLPDRAQMFRAAALVFKDGDLVVRDGHVTHDRWGRALETIWQKTFLANSRHGW